MKRYMIAGLAVDMDVSGQTEKRAAAYAAANEGPADITLDCDIRGVLALNPELKSYDLAQYMGTGAYFSRELLKFDGSYLHASAVILNGKAYLFSANSGTGKSTHTEKWCRLFGAKYLNDDKPALRRVDGVWFAYGTPWSGKHDLSSPEGVPLGGIAFLKRGQENTIKPMAAGDAVKYFMSQSLWQLGDSASMEKQLSLVDDILRRIPIWELTCRNDDAAAFVSRNAMVKE